MGIFYVIVLCIGEFLQHFCWADISKTNGILLYDEILKYFSLRRELRRLRRVAKVEKVRKIKLAKDTYKKQILKAKHFIGRKIELDKKRVLGRLSE
jgi:uncharacterized membrane protein